MSVERESGIIEKLFETGSGRTPGISKYCFGKRGSMKLFHEINRAFAGSLSMKTQDVGRSLGLSPAQRRRLRQILLDK